MVKMIVRGVTVRRPALVGPAFSLRLSASVWMLLPLLSFGRMLALLQGITGIAIVRGSLHEVVSKFYINNIIRSLI